jgi:hypothetical protein
MHVYLATQKYKDTMEALLFVLVLFVAAIASPWLFPNKMVSNNKYDNEA